MSRNPLTLGGGGKLIKLKTSTVISGIIFSLLTGSLVQGNLTPAQARTSSSLISNSIAKAALPFGPYGPTCAHSGTNGINLIKDGPTRKYKLSDLLACSTFVAPKPAPTVTPVAKPTVSPSPTSTPLFTLGAPESIEYTLGKLPTGITATLSAKGGIDYLAISASQKINSGYVEVLATYRYLDETNPDFEYVDTNKIKIPLKSKIKSPPTCRSFTVTTLKNKPVVIPLAFDETREGGCEASAGYGPLTYKIGSVKYSKDKSKTLRRDQISYRFEPRADWVTPSDNCRKASFDVIATDLFGQTSLALDKANAPVLDANEKQVSAATFYINVNKKRACTKSQAETKNGVIFNDPRGHSKNKYAITNEIIRLIDCAKPGSHITMSWFSMTDENFVNHLIQANRAGVNVRVLLNSHAISPKSTSYTAYATLKREIGSTIGSASAASGSGSWISYCKSGCLTPKAPKGLKFPDDSEGEYPALHSKFFMFSELVNGDSVVGISSINPTYAQAVSGFNNASIIVNDQKLFSSLATYFKGLAKSAKTKGKTKVDSYTVLKSKSKTTTYTTFPRLGSGGETDNVTQAFSDVQCIYTENMKVKRTKIYVNMFVFTRNSPAIKLWRLANNSKLNGGGCEVHLIYTDMDQRIKALNTKTNKWEYLPNAGKISNYGVADCLSTPATNKSGKVQQLTIPGKSWSASENRYVTSRVCAFGSLQGKMPTINQGGGYCWLQSKSTVSGGLIDGCVSTPLAITVFDKADNRAKLEAIPDSNDKKWYSHQKYILIDGMVAGERTKMVISGTPNISSPGLRWNDEIMTISKSENIYKKYLANYKLMRKAIKGRAAPAFNPEATQVSW